MRRNNDSEKVKLFSVLFRGLLACPERTKKLGQGQDFHREGVGREHKARGPTLWSVPAIQKCNEPEPDWCSERASEWKGGGGEGRREARRIPHS